MAPNATRNGTTEALPHRPVRGESRTTSDGFVSFGALNGTELERRRTAHLSYLVRSRPASCMA